MKLEQLVISKATSDELKERDQYLLDNFVWDRVNGTIVGPYVSRRQKPKSANSRTTYWMIYLHVCGKWRWLVEEQNLIKFLVTGFWDGEADHIDHNGLNNKESNLRFGCKKDNCGNRQISLNSTSGYPNVSRERSKWRVRIVEMVQGLRTIRDLGSFSDYFVACTVARDARLALGRFAPPLPER